LNPQPPGHEPSTLTTRPLLLTKKFNVLLNVSKIIKRFVKKADVVFKTFEQNQNL
jgi:hypothetical protein